MTTKWTNWGSRFSGGWGSSKVIVPWDHYGKDLSEVKFYLFPVFLSGGVESGCPSHDLANACWLYVVRIIKSNETKCVFKIPWINHTYRTTQFLKIQCRFSVGWLNYKNKESKWIQSRFCQTQKNIYTVHRKFTPRVTCLLSDLPSSVNLFLQNL